MPNKSLTVEEVLSMLAAAPPHIAELADGLADSRLQVAPAPGEWSANEVLAHLRACADMWGSCIREIIAHDRPTIRAINPRTWIDKTDYREQAFHPSLEAYAKQRAELMAALEPLPAQGWQRTATITGAGKVLERDVLFYGRWLASHERPHLKQIERIASVLRKA